MKRVDQDTGEEREPAKREKKKRDEEEDAA
jgi:hypothetical protein